MVEETPTGMMEENVEEVQGEPTREQLEAIAMEIFQLRLEELDEEQLMVVYQAAMEQQPQEEEEMMQEDIEDSILKWHDLGWDAYTAPREFRNKWRKNWSWRWTHESWRYGKRL